MFIMHTVIILFAIYGALAVLYQFYTTGMLVKCIKICLSPLAWFFKKCWSKTFVYHYYDYRRILKLSKKPGKWGVVSEEDYKYYMGLFGKGKTYHKHRYKKQLLALLEKRKPEGYAVTKKVTEWLADLPEPYRTQALVNTSKVDGEKIEVDLRNALRTAFIWLESTEGSKYWLELYKSLKEGSIK